MEKIYDITGDSMQQYQFTSICAVEQVDLTVFIVFVFVYFQRMINKR